MRQSGFGDKCMEEMVMMKEGSGDVGSEEG